MAKKSAPKGQKIKFNKYENIVTGDHFYALAEDAVRKTIDNEDFIEVTTDLENINQFTVFMVKADSIKKCGEAWRNL